MRKRLLSINREPLADSPINYRDAREYRRPATSTPTPTPTTARLTQKGPESRLPTGRQPTEPSHAWTVTTTTTTAGTPDKTGDPQCRRQLKQTGSPETAYQPADLTIGGKGHNLGKRVTHTDTEEQPTTIRSPKTDRPHNAHKQVRSMETPKHVCHLAASLCGAAVRHRAVAQAADQPRTAHQQAHP